MLNEICSVCQDVSLLGYVGFDVAFEILDIKKTKTCDTDILQQNALAADMCSGIVSLLEHRLTSMLWHLISWPGKFALMLKDDFGPASQYLAVLQRDLFAFQAAVGQGEGNAWILKLTKSSPSNIRLMIDVCRLLRAPSPREFSLILNTAQRVVWQIFSGWGNTKITGDNFKKMREREP